MLFILLIVVARAQFGTQAGEIAFESNRSGNWEIYLLDVQTGGTYNLTRSQADDYTPAWSPDGRQIAFVSDRNGDLRTELYVMNADGSGLQSIGDDAREYRNPVWTNDGAMLLYTHGWKQMFARDMNSGVEQWLGVGFAPHLAPDGTTLLYYDQAPGESISHVYMLDLSKHRDTDLTPAETHNGSPVWSPNNAQIAFVSTRNGNAGIYVMNTDGSDLHAVSSRSSDFAPSWSADGSEIIFASGTNGRTRLFAVKADGSDRHPLTAPGISSNAPAWRPQSR